MHVSVRAQCEAERGSFLFTLPRGTECPKSGCCAPLWLATAMLHVPAWPVPVYWTVPRVGTCGGPCEARSPVGRQKPEARRGQGSNVPWGWGAQGRGCPPVGPHVEWEAGSSAACLVLNCFMEPQATFCRTHNSPIQSLHFCGLDKVPSSGLRSALTPRAPSSCPKEAGLPVAVAPSPSQPLRPPPSLSAGTPQQVPQQEHFWQGYGPPGCFITP